MTARWSPAKLVAGAALAALAAAALAPLLLRLGRPEALPLYWALEALCHQTPDRCWLLGGAPAGLCVRCCGLYAGLALAGSGLLRFSPSRLAAAALLMGLSWAVEAAGAAHPPPWTRWAAGAAFGVVAGAVFRPGRPRQT
ncbi:MAG: DUF2085 domain-containing protein [Acidobacteria bacterium]|nr:DUF2085 domain-containing protein [Acidobacteriota bacterium]